MRWFRRTKAGIPPATRVVLEQHGTETIRTLLVMRNWVLDTGDGARFAIDDNRKFILSWLKEQADREERRETWLITMEIAITLFVDKLPK